MASTVGFVIHIDLCVRVPLSKKVSNAVVTCEIKLFQRFVSHVTTALVSK